MNNITPPFYSILQSAASTPLHTLDDTSLSSESSDLMPYIILLDSGITIEQRYDELFNIGRVDDSATPSNYVATDLK